MSITPDQYTEVLASFGLVAGVPAVKSGVGIVEPIGFVAPGSWTITLSAAVAQDAAVLLAVGRNGWLASARRLSDTVVEVTTYDGNGPGVGAWDLLVGRVPLVVSPVSPDPDPVGVPIGGGGGTPFSPPVYWVTPISPPPAGQFNSIGAAIAQAQADGYGGVPLPAQGRALVMVLPGRYLERITLVQGIDVCALPQIRNFQTQVRSPGGAPGPLLTLTPAAGGNGSADYVSWRGVDVVPAAGDTGILIDGAGTTQRGKLYISQCSVEGAGRAIHCTNAADVSGGRSELRSENVTYRVTVEGGPPAMEFSGTMDCEFVDSFVRQGTSFDNIAILMASVSVGSVNVRFNQLELDGVYSNPAPGNGQVTFALARLRAGITPPIVTGNTTLLSTLCGNVLLASVNPVVTGVGSFVWALVTTPPPPGAPFAATLNGGAGAVAGRIPVGFATAVPAAWVAPAPQDQNVAIDRIAAVVAGAHGPIP